MIDRPEPELVAYRRVSTAKQGQSGLGIDGQDIDLERHRARVNGRIVRTFTEVETGTRKRERPILAEALRYCRRTGATLVIAKLDRLSRNVHFLSGLMESGVDFVCCDNPSATRLTLHILAAVAEDEAARTSERTRKALEAFRVNRAIPKRLREQYPNGVPTDLAESVAGKLGAELPWCRNLTDQARAVGAATSAARARERAVSDNAHLTPKLLTWRNEGLSFAAIAAKLNQSGETTRTGAEWSGTQVKRVLDRI